MQHIPALQGLRAVAIIAVVIYHAWPWLLPGGYLGVDVFFVLSGYLITRLLVRELSATGRLDLVEFYARRTRRLAPALIAVVIGVMLVSLVYHAPLERKMLSSSAVSSLAYLSNFWFASLATDYLQGARHDDPLLHTWSLSIEEQFYVVWPVFLWLLHRASTATATTRLAAGIGGLVVISFAACVVTAQTLTPWAFFGSLFRAWEFGVGALVTVLGKRLVTSRFLRFGTGEAGLALLLYSLYSFSASTAHPGAATWLPVLATCLVLIAAESPYDSGTRRVLSLRPAQWIGDLSYSWYLWHWPALVFLRDVLGVHSLTGTLTAIVASLAISVASYAFLESPIRRHRRLVAAPRVSLAILATASLCAVVAVFGLRLTATRAATSADQMRFFEASDDRPRVYDEGCHARYEDEELASCTYGDPSAQHVVVLLGDSHAAQWFPALEVIAMENRWKLVSLTKSACPPVLFEPFDANLRRRYYECTRWRENALSAIEALKPDLVLVSSSRNYAELTPGGPSDEWQQGSAALFERVSRSADHVVVLEDTPWPPSDIPTCLARARWRGLSSEACDFPRESATTVTRLMWAAAGSRHSNVRVADVGALVCPAARCSAERGGTIAYADSNHLTATFSRSLAPALARLLDRPVVGAGLMEERPTASPR